ncbi:CmcJ/NvfI family oxidoreductase [Solimonas terrae]|uniref:Methyltransferase n=1 Tax=Solimonas terrae TaxID=1396819 RepID=A0A6M2BZ33_9GAMM|nr:CmcJ/NvfI family oxidoreductase [Solimonas terrae]NGY07007.1 hypothetical protein [Solimonas terrae]
MPTSTAVRAADTEHVLPSVNVALNFSQNIPRARSSVLDPSQTYMPLESHEITIRDARPIRDQFDLDVQGFALFDHKSSVTHLREPKKLDATYHEEVGSFIKSLSGADVVLPYRIYLQCRLSQRAPGENGDATTRPAGFAHADITEKTFHDWVRWVQDDENTKVPSFKRAALYQTWRAVSEPPHDYPLTLADARHTKTGQYVVMDNITSLETDDHTVETRLGLYDPAQRWYYFSNMRESELLVFKGYDSRYNDTQTVLHTGFDNTALHPNASPRESIEARFFAFWL